MHDSDIPTEKALAEGRTPSTALVPEPSRPRDSHISLINMRGRPFGVAGHRGGRPPGARNRAALAAEALLVGEAESLTRKAVELALAGNAMALKLCIERLIPRRRERTVAVDLPPLATAQDCLDALRQVAAAVAAGEVSPAEGMTLTDMIEKQRVTLRSDELQRAARP